MRRVCNQYASIKSRGACDNQAGTGLPRARKASAHARSDARMIRAFSFQSPWSMSRLVLSDTTDVFARQLSSDPTVSFVPAETTVYPPLVPDPSLNGRVHISRAEPHRDDLTLERVGCERDSVSYHARITSRQRKLLDCS